jgi:hypothetical protein
MEASSARFVRMTPPFRITRMPEPETISPAANVWSVVTSQVVSRVPRSQVKAAQAGVDSSTMETATGRKSRRARQLKRVRIWGDFSMGQPFIRIVTEPCSV